MLKKLLTPICQEQTLSLRLLRESIRLTLDQHSHSVLHTLVAHADRMNIEADTRGRDRRYGLDNFRHFGRVDAVIKVFVAVKTKYVSQREKVKRRKFIKRGLVFTKSLQQ